MTLHHHLLRDPVIRVRTGPTRALQSCSLPQVYALLCRDDLRDFPALRPHQRHPWHAFLVQLAAIALHHQGETHPWDNEADWQAALQALTPDHPDGAPWALVAPLDQPALLQAPVPEGTINALEKQLVTPDELDMLVTARNHDLKAARMIHSAPDDWLLALVSLQTQEGFLGSGNYGISRMNGGFSSRPGVGAVPAGGYGARWRRDVNRLLKYRENIATQEELMNHGGIALLWLAPWDGKQSLNFAQLDPFYIEICRRIRLQANPGGTLTARATGTASPRVDAKARNGRTGDPWTPINQAEGKALSISARGYHYELMTRLLFSADYVPALAQILEPEDGLSGITILAQGVTRGQGKTEGYHERRVPLSPKVQELFVTGHTDQLAAVAATRVNIIGEMRKVLWTALATLFDQGAQKESFSDTAKRRANDFCHAFEQREDENFFHHLNQEMESTDPAQTRLAWMLALSESAESTLRRAFIVGPRSGEQRYRAQSRALSRFHGTLRGPHSPLPDLAHYLKSLSTREEETPQ